MSEETKTSDGQTDKLQEVLKALTPAFATLVNEAQNKGVQFIRVSLKGAETKKVLGGVFITVGLLETELVRQFVDLAESRQDLSWPHVETPEDPKPASESLAP
jgi:hypothetical protein